MLTCAQGYDGTGRVGALRVLAHIVQALEHPPASPHFQNGTGAPTCITSFSK